MGKIFPDQFETYLYSLSSLQYMFHEIIFSQLYHVKIWSKKPWGVEMILLLLCKDWHGCTGFGSSKPEAAQPSWVPHAWLWVKQGSLSPSDFWSTWQPAATPVSCATSLLGDVVKIKRVLSWILWDLGCLWSRSKCTYLSCSVWFTRSVYYLSWYF